MSHLFAVIVGINDYAEKPLSGCVPDALSVKEYLEHFYGSHGSVQLHIHLMAGENTPSPTRSNIINAFDFFNAAEPGDTCLFYYSGHGSCFTAPQGFRDDNGELQTLVCIDSRLPGGSDLVDKELGFLIWKTMQTRPGVHFIAVTDCCHSGSVTKAFIDSSDITDRLVTGNAEAIPKTPEQFLGYNETVNGDRFYIEMTDAAGETYFATKQPPHIHLAASQNRQTAKERKIDGRKWGACTYALLKILYASNGQISYQNLANQAAVMVSNLVPDQVPQLNLNGGIGLKAKDLVFLSQEPAPDAGFLVYNDPAYEWCIKAGLAQGFSIGDIVHINGVGATTIKATPFPDFSVIQPLPELDSYKKTFTARVQQQPNKQLGVAFATTEINETARLLLEQAINANKNGLVYTSEQARFFIRQESNTGKLYIALPGTENPSLTPVSITSQQEAEQFVANLENMACWLNVLELNNNGALQQGKHFVIKLFIAKGAREHTPEQFTEVTDLKSITPLYYTKNNNEYLVPAFRLSITNCTNRTLWVSNAYLLFDYAIDTGFFETMELGPGRTGWLSFIRHNRTEDMIPMRIEEQFRKQGYSEVTEYLKLFVGTSAINVKGLNQKGLELAPKETVQTKSIFKGDAMIIPAPDGWATETIGFCIIRGEE